MVQKNLTLPQLKAKAVNKFHAFIRKRDHDKPCISCGRFAELQAGHFYAGGKVQSLKFNEDNVNGQCVQCNYYLHGNLIEYRKGLVSRIGIERVQRLDWMASREKQTGYKWDRWTLIEIIEKYK